MVSSGIANPKSVYVSCPHCEYPAVLVAPRLGETYRCRQCSRAFVLERQDEAKGSDTIERNKKPAR